MLAYEWYCKKTVSFFLKAKGYITLRTSNKCSTWEHTVHRCLVFKKIGKCDGGIEPGLWALVCLDGWWFGEDSFLLTKEAINFNAMHILNSFRVRSLFSDFLYTIKELTGATSNRSKNKQRKNRNFDLWSSWYADSSWSIKSTTSI